MEQAFNEVIAQIGFVHLHWKHVIMWFIAGLFIWLAIKKQYEPLLLLPIGFGIFLVNLPLTPLMGVTEHGERELIKYFYDFVNLCRENDIALYVVISPKYVMCDNCSSFSHEICNKVKVELHDFSSENLFLSNKHYFGDPAHLNFKGSRLYSKFIGSELLDFYNDFQYKKSSITSRKKHT